MNTIPKLVAVVALAAVGPVLAQSTIDYTLTLGGDNHLSDWENCLPATYSYPNPNPDQDGQAYNVGDTVNWAAKALAGGTHSGGLGDGLAPAGVANLVFTLTLTGPSGAVMLEAGGPGTAPGDQGWYSTINDGVDNSITGCVPTIRPLEPLENAAYPAVFDIQSLGSASGRLFDGYSDNGPGLDYYHYPSAVGRPSLADIGDGGLHGMGAGYSLFYPQFLGGTSACTLGLADLPLFEGQINTTGLDSGSYTLTLAVEQGNNILPGISGMCDFGSTGAFAVAANSVGGDTIQFSLSSPCTEPVVSTATSSATHGTAGTYPIDLLASGASECREAGGNSPPLAITVTFDQAVQQGSTPVVSVSPTGNVTNVVVSGTQVTFDVDGLTDDTTATISFPGLVDACGGTIAVTGTVAMDYRLGNAQEGDPQSVDIFDMVTVRNGVNAPNNGVVDGSTFRSDIRPDGTIDIFDLVLVRNNLY